eukprot:6670730-Pyramimonas_sp.AAC.1
MPNYLRVLLWGLGGGGPTVVQSNASNLRCARSHAVYGNELLRVDHSRSRSTAAWRARGSL